MTTRVHKPGWLKTLDKIVHPGRTLRRWGKRKAKKITGKKTTRVVKGGRPTAKAAKAMGGGPVRQVGVRYGGDIVPGKTRVEWIYHPEMGPGLALGWLQGGLLEVEFADGSRPWRGVPPEEVLILA